MGNGMVTKCCQNCTKDKEGGDIAIDELENITNNNLNNNGKPIETKNINITETNDNLKINEKIKVKSKQNIQKNDINNNNINDTKENEIEEKKNYKQTQASTGAEIKENKKLNNNNFFNDKNNNFNSNNNSNNNLNDKNDNFNSNNNSNNNLNDKNDNCKSNNNLNSNNNINEKSKDEKTILIYGPPESGKTSFIIRYFENKFDSCYIPSFSDEITKRRCFLNYGKKFNLEIIVSNNLNQIQNADCYFIFFDISSKNSFEESKKIINNIINYNKVIFLIGNKKDLKNVVLEKNIQDLCKKYHLEYFLISVKDNIGISAMMKKFGEIFDYEE